METVVESLVEPVAALVDQGSAAPLPVDEIVLALSALAQVTRLQVFRLLVRAGPAGRSAGDLAAELHVPAPTLSFHLRELARTRLVIRRADGRHAFYSADYTRVAALLQSLTADCCGGNPCLPLAGTAAEAPRCCG